MKNKTLQKLTITSIAAFTLIGCGGGGGGSTGNNNGSNNPVGNGNNDPYKIVPVSYSLNGSEAPSCPDAYRVTIVKAQKADDIGVASCFWLCGQYEGARPVSVQLTFQQNGKGSSWQFDSDVIITAPDQCHN